MELLINGMLSRGARRDRLQAKLFGGGRLLRGLTDIGRKNGEFAERFLKDEGIPCLGSSLGGDHARRIIFSPASGRVRQQKLVDIDQNRVFESESKPKRPNVSSGDIELFGG